MMLLICLCQHIVFVYGTLKRNCYNHIAYLAPSVDVGNAKYLGTAKTISKFPLLLGVPPRNVPILYDAPGFGHVLEGELYKVNDAALEGLDELEGVARGFYSRREIPVLPLSTDDKGDGDGDNNDDGDEVVSAWVYTQSGYSKVKDNIGADELVPCYTTKMNSIYVPPQPHVNQELLRLFVQRETS